MTKHIAIVGAGPGGLMAAEVLSQSDYEVHVFEQKPSAARKFLMAGKPWIKRLNISQRTSSSLERLIRDWLNWIKR